MRTREGQGQAKTREDETRAGQGRAGGGKDRQDQTGPEKVTEGKISPFLLVFVVVFLVMVVLPFASVVVVE